MTPEEMDPRYAKAKARTAAQEAEWRVKVLEQIERLEAEIVQMQGYSTWPPLLKNHQSDWSEPRRNLMYAIAYIKAYILRDE
jgi:hypothetical protein